MTRAHLHSTASRPALAARLPRTVTFLKSAAMGKTEDVLRNMLRGPLGTGMQCLISSDRHRVEVMGADYGRSPPQLIMTTSSGWVVPDGMEERWFAVIDIPARRGCGKSTLADLVKHLTGGRA